MNQKEGQTNKKRTARRTGRYIKGKPYGKKDKQTKISRATSLSKRTLITYTETLYYAQKI